MEDEKQNSRDSLDNQQNGDPMFELADDYENEDEEGDSDGYQDFLKPNKKITDSVMSILDSELIQNLKEEDKINSNASIKKAVTEYFDSTSNEQPQSTISIEIEPQTITTPNEKLSIKENDTSTTTQPKVMEPPEVTIINSTSLVQISEPLINPDVTMLDANKLHSIMKSQPNSPLPRRVSTNRSISFSVDEQQQKNGSNRKNNISKEEPVFGNASEPPIRRVQSEKKAKLAEKFSQSPESSIVISIQDFGNETIATQPFSSDYSFEFSSPTVSVTKPTSTTSTDEAFSTIGQYEHSMESNGEELDTLFVEGRKSTKLTFIKEAVSESKELLGNSTEILRHSITKIPTLDFREGMLLQAIKEYHATDLDELSLEIGTLVELDVTPQNEGEYWLKGTAANGQSGFFPRQCVTEYNEKNANEIKEKEVEKNFSPNENDSIMEEEAVKPVPKGTTVTAIYAYEPTKKDELALAKGSTILVLECPDGGWWKGVTGIEDKRPVTGWFPASLVKIKENAPEKAKAKEEVFKSDNDEKMNSLDVGSENGRKVSWFRRLRSPTETNPDFTESERRKRSLSAPAKRLPLLNVSGSELPNIFGGSDLSRDELDRSLSGFEIKPIVTDGEFSTSSARASVSLPRGTTIDINSLPSTNIQGRGTIYLSGAGNNGEIFPGATDEKIQDKVSPAIYKFLPDSEKQRLSVVWELIQTERDYVRDLSIIIEIFMKPISSLPSIIPKNIQTLFGNIEQILTVHTDFLYLLNQIDDIRNITAICEVFLVIGERFMCYIPYCSNQQASSAKFVKTLLNKADVKALLEEQYRNPVLRQLDISGFLLKPVQRICKYPLLIREMIKSTPKEHSDLINLNKVMEKMSNAVATINECAKKLNGMKPMAEVQNKFSEKINIVNSNRFLVREDSVNVIFSDGKKLRKLFLFNDLLIFARRDWRDKHHVIEKTNLKDIRICDIAETAGGGVSTMLLEIEILPSSEFDSPNRYIIAMLTLQEKNAWLDAYKSLVRYVVKSKNLSDITMTSSSADGAGDDEDMEKPQPREEDEVIRAKKARDAEQLESELKALKEKITLLEKIAVERDAKIKDWEMRAGTLEMESRESEKKLNEFQLAKASELNTLMESEKRYVEANAKLLDQLQLARAAEEKSATRIANQDVEIQSLTSQIFTQKKLYREVESELDDMSAKYKAQVLTSEKLNTSLLTQQERTQTLEQILFQKNKDFGDTSAKKDGVIEGLKSELKIASTKLAELLEMALEAKNIAQSTAVKANQAALKEESNDNILAKLKTSLEDMIHQLSEKEVTILEQKTRITYLVENSSELKEQINQKDTQIADINKQGNNLKKKIEELDLTILELKSQISNIKKQLIESEAINEDQRSNTRKLVAENDNIILNLRNQLKNESENSKANHSNAKELANEVQLKDTVIKEQMNQIQQLSLRLNSTSTDITEKDSTMKSLIDRTNNLQKTVDEVSNILGNAYEDSVIKLIRQGGLTGQLKSILQSYSDAVIERNKKISDLELDCTNLKAFGDNKNEELNKLTQRHTKLAEEIQEQNIVLSKKKEKLAATKEELVNAKEESESLKLIIGQQKNNLEQARSTIEHMKLSATSSERQQRQIQLALDEARKECLGSQENVKMLQVTIQKHIESISELENKLSEQIQLNQEKALTLTSNNRKIKEKEDQLVESENNLRITQNRLAQKEIDYRELENRFSVANEEMGEKMIESSKQIKKLKSDLTENESKYLTLQNQATTDKDRIKFDADREIAHVKSQITELESALLVSQQKLQQREAKFAEIELVVKDLRFQLNEHEIMKTNSQNKLTLKDSKISEYETTILNQVATLNQLKQKYNDAELSLVNAQTKLNEIEAKTQKGELLIATLNTTINSLNSRNTESKNQIEIHLDSIKRLERDKKDLTMQLDEANHTNANLNKEMRVLKEHMNDIQIKLNKTENQLVILQRESQRDLQNMDEKQKLLSEKEKVEKLSEISLLKTEYHNYKQHSISEQNRIKNENEEKIREMEKEYQESVNVLIKKSENEILELKNVLKNYKERVSNQTEELKQANSVHVDQIKSKTELALELLKQTLKESQQKVSDLERSSMEKDSKLKSTEIENVKYSLQIEKLNDEIHKLKTSSIAFEETHYVQVKGYERKINENNEIINKKQADLDQLIEKFNEHSQKMVNLNLMLELERKELKASKEEIQELLVKQQSIESKHFSEISLIKTQKQDLEMINHENLLHVERVRHSEQAHKDMIQKLKEDLDDSKKVAQNLNLQWNETNKERLTLQLKISQLDDNLARKMKELEALELKEKDNTASLKVKDDKIHEYVLKLDQLQSQLEMSSKKYQKLEEDMIEYKTSTKKLVETEKESTKRLQKEGKKKFQQDLEQLESKISTEWIEKSKRKEKDYEEIIRVSKQNEEALRKDYETLKSKFEILTQSESELKEWKMKLENEIQTYMQNEEGLIGELEEKVKELLAIKRKLKNAESEISSLSTQLATLKSSNQETIDNLTDVYNECQLLQTSKQQLELDSIQYRQDIENLQGIISDFVPIQLEHEQLVEERVGHLTTLTQLETQSVHLKKILFKQSKILASVQITLTEISSLFGIVLPWSSEDLLAYPEKLRNSFKEGNYKVSVDSINSKLLIDVVSTARDITSELENFKQGFQSEKKMRLELQELQSKSEVQLSETSALITKIQASMDEKDQRLKVLYEKVKNKEQVEKSLDKALLENRGFEKRLKDMSEEMSYILKDKELLERDYIILYEKMQSSKNEFQERSKIIQEDSNKLIDGYQLGLLKLEKQRETIKNLTERVHVLDEECQSAVGLRDHAESLLNSTKQKVEELKKENQTLMAEKERIMKEFTKEKDELLYKSSQIFKTKEKDIGHLEEELVKSQTQTTHLTTSLLESTKILEEFKEKWLLSINREKESQNRALRAEKERAELQLQLRAFNEDISSVASITGERQYHLEHELENVRVSRIKPKYSIDAQSLDISNTPRRLLDPRMVINSAAPIESDETMEKSYLTSKN